MKISLAIQSTLFDRNLQLPDNNKSYSVWDIQQHFFERIPPKQLLKWIGNKQRFAAIIAKVFPENYKTYIEPFVGSGAVLGTLAPKKGLAGDTLEPLIGMWNLLKKDPQLLYDHYKKSWNMYMQNPKETYIKNTNFI